MFARVRKTVSADDNLVITNKITAITIIKFIESVKYLDSWCSGFAQASPVITHSVGRLSSGGHVVQHLGCHLECLY